MERDLMKAAAKFTVKCERCSRTICKDVTAHTAKNAMDGHERSHRAEDQGGAAP